MRRRRFLQGLSMAALGAAGGRARARAADPARGRVLEVRDPAAAAADGTVDPARVARLVDRALTLWTGDADPAAALARYVSPSDTVGLKLNCMGCPRMAVEPAVTARLLELVAEIGVAPNRTVVYDQYRFRLVRAGYTLQEEPGRVRVVHARSEDWGYTGKTHTYDEERSFLWSTFLQRSSAVINLCVPKDHDLCGVSGALKNMAMGNVDQPFLFHPVVQQAVPRLYARPEIRRRVRLVVCDATRVLWHGGPQDNPVHSGPYGGILLATDPVAMDWAIVELVNEHRRRHRMEPLQDVEKPRARPPTHVANAAALGLGARSREVLWLSVAADGSSRYRRLRHVGHVTPELEPGG